jgi:hypothetical protein
MKTSLQTVDVTVPDTTLEYKGLEFVPVLPSSYTLDNEDSIHIKKVDGSYVSWFSDGSVTHESGQITRLWQPRPTLADAISYKNNDGGVFIFKKDTVECRWGGVNYYWSSDIYESEPVDGVRVYYCHECEAEINEAGGICKKCQDALYRDYYRFGY